MGLPKACAFSLLIINPSNWKCSSYPHLSRVHRSPQDCLGDGTPVLFIPVYQAITIHTGNWNRTWKLELEKSARYWGWLPHGGIFSDNSPTGVFSSQRGNEELTICQWSGIQALSLNSRVKWFGFTYDLGKLLNHLQNRDNNKMKQDLVYRVLSPAPYTKLLSCK